MLLNVCGAKIMRKVDVQLRNDPDMSGCVEPTLGRRYDIDRSWREELLFFSSTYLLSKQYIIVEQQATELNILKYILTWKISAATIHVMTLNEDPE